MLPEAAPFDALLQHISEILSAYDDLIENNRRRMALLEDAARLLYREWFVHFRFPGHEHVKIIDGIPEGWDARNLGECVTFQSGGTPSKSKAVYWSGDNPVRADLCTMIPTWRSAGYRVKLLFLGLTSAEEAVARVAMRVRQGGHDIPPEVIRRRFLGLKNFRDVYRPRVDCWQ